MLTYVSSTPDALNRVQWLLMARTEAKRAKRSVSFTPDDQKTTLYYSSDDDEPHLAVDVDDDQPESLLAKAKVCAPSHTHALRATGVGTPSRARHTRSTPEGIVYRSQGLMRQHRQYIRERQQLIERTRTEWKESVQAIDAEPDHAERARLRNQLMVHHSVTDHSPDSLAVSTSCVRRVLRRCATNAPSGPTQDAKRVLEVQAKQLNDEARHLRSLKQCIQVGAVGCVNVCIWAWRSQGVMSFTHGPTPDLQASSNELKEQGGMRVSAGAAGTSASSRAALRSSLDAVARAVAAAHSAASALPQTPTAAWGEPSDNRCLPYVPISTPVYEDGSAALRR